MDNELDLRILKAITTDRINALTYVNKFDHTFFSKEHQFFGKLCLDYINTFRAPPTERTLLEFQKDKSNQPIIEGAWQDLELLEYDNKEYPFDLEQFKKRYQHQKIEEIKEEAKREEDVEDYEAFVKDLSLKINEIVRIDIGRSFLHESVGDFSDKFKENYENIQKNPQSIKKIKTGFSAYDALTGGGVAAGELIMWGAETGGGKSMALNNMSKNIWLQDNDIGSDIICPGHNILFFSLEMPLDMCFNRFLASLADVKMSDLAKATLSTEHKERVDVALDFIKRYQKAGYFFDIVDFPRGLTTSDMELRISDAMLRYIPDVIVVDYMNLMGVPSSMAREQDWLRMGYLAASLHEIARIYNVPVITAAQLTDIKRGSQTKESEENKRVGVHRWGRSSMIMHNVNVGVQIETRPNERELFDLVYHFVKNRNGPLGEGVMIKNFANASLVDIPFEEETDKDISANIPDLIRKFKEKGTEE